MTDSVNAVFGLVYEMMKCHWCEILLAAMTLSMCSALASWSLGKLHFDFFRDRYRKDDKDG